MGNKHCVKLIKDLMGCITNIMMTMEHAMQMLEELLEKASKE
jgi:hypothetical protein